MSLFHLLEDFTAGEVNTGAALAAIVAAGIVTGCLWLFKEMAASP